MAEPTIGFIGLGRMGSPMAGRLMDAGYELVVSDVNQAAVDAAAGRGAGVAASPKEVADRADIVLLSVPTPDIVRQISLGDEGLIHGARAKHVIDLSTTGPSTAKEVEAALKPAGIQYVDSPVSGGIAGATNGTLAVMVSCPAGDFPVVEPVVKTFGKVFNVGETPGSGQVVKLGNNMMAASALVVTSEALAMGVKAGVDPKVMLDIINISSGRNSASQDKFPKAVLTGTFDFGFATALSYKDVRMCVEESELLGVPMLAGALTRQMLTITKAKYGPDSDFTCIAKLLEEWAGVEIRG